MNDGQHTGGGAWRLVLFVVAAVAAFVYMGNAIPQIKSAPVEIETEIGESPAELIAAGKRLFESDRAQCLTCHSIGEDPKARCPNQEGLGERAGKSEPGKSASRYLVESLYNPNAFVVPGYPANQMTPVNKAPIALSHEEILAVIAYLNTLGGQSDEAFIQDVRNEQEPWRKGLLQPEVAAVQSKPAILPGDVDRGRILFEKQGCNKCHRVDRDGPDLAPELTAIAASQSPHYILESIIDPNAVIVKGYKQVTILWKDEYEDDLQGIPVAWLPDQEHPRTLRLSVDADGGEREEREIDLADVAALGDAMVAVEIGDEFIRHSGDYVAGDETNGVTIRVLEDGAWGERTIPPDGIQFINFPMSPMPSNFAELMTPREMYDLLAFLLAMKGET